MTPRELLSYQEAILKRIANAKELVSDFLPAPSETESDDVIADSFFEALFLRQFVQFESDLEKLFIHYLTGGASLGGRVAPTHLNVTDEETARRIVRGGWKFLSWSKPETIRNTAQTYIDKGWPINEMMNAKSKDLADCERIRNCICHISDSARAQFDVVQRNLLHTERTFPISPGQLLRIRSTRLRKFHIEHYVEIMHETLKGILDPPAL